MITMCFVSSSFWHKWQKNKNLKWLWWLLVSCSISSLKSHPQGPLDTTEKEQEEARLWHSTRRLLHVGAAFQNLCLAVVFWASCGEVVSPGVLVLPASPCSGVSQTKIAQIQHCLAPPQLSSSMSPPSPARQHNVNLSLTHTHFLLLHHALIWCILEVSFENSLPLDY